MTEFEGHWLVWALDLDRSCKCYSLIGLNVTHIHAVEIAEARANQDYPTGWERQGNYIFHTKNNPGSPSADIMIIDFLADSGR